MRLVDYIERHKEEIMAEWVRFAATLVPPGERIDYDRLRDHGDELLAALMSDMERPAGGRAPPELESSERGAKQPLSDVGKVHAAYRMAHGFSLPDLVREYRALRSGVLSGVFRLWGQGPVDDDGLLRFNAAIDEALMEAVVEYAERTSQYRDEILGVVTHDLRNPLSAVLIWARRLARSPGGGDVVQPQARKIVQSAQRMTRIVNDLLDLTRIRFGLEMPVIRAPTDIGELARGIIAEMEASYPNATIRLTTRGELRGRWDGERIEQVFANLLSNALQHGDPSQPIVVSLVGSDEAVTIAVHNEGTSIPKTVQVKIFEPGFRNAQSSPLLVRGLGLGLYIVKKIVLAHEGEIHVASTKESGTTFTIRLLRGEG